MELADRLKALTALRRAVGADPAAVLKAVEAMRPAPAASSTPTRQGPLSMREALASRATAADPARFTDVVRICKVRIVLPMAPEEREEVSRTHVLAPAYDDGFRLFPQQADAIQAIEDDPRGGLFGNIGVGFGKTLISLMAAEHAWKRGMDRIVLSPPAHVMEQLLLTDVPTSRRRIPLSVPIFNCQGRPRADRLALAKSSARGLFVVPHSLYSASDSVEFLEALRVQKYIIDECHAFSDRSAARTRRLLHLLGSHPELVVLSGSMSAKSVMDYHHLIVGALGYSCPLPISGSLASEWGLIIDAAAEEDVDRAQTGPIEPLLHWARRYFPRDAERISMDRTGFRHAYQLRLNSTPGVVSSGDAAIPTSLTIVTTPIPADVREATEGWADLMELFRKLEEAWVTPNGDEIEHAIHLFKWRFELSAGFYNKLFWPSFDSLRARGISDPESRLERTQEWFEADQRYARALRMWFGQEHIPGLDTPMTVGREFSVHGARRLPANLYALWHEARSLRFDGMIERDREAVRVCPYKINAAADWAERLGKNEGALVWCWNREVAKWAADVFAERGLDPILCGQGANAAILAPENARRKIVATIPAHGTGKNLQAFRHTIYLQFPRSARLAEQVIGRTHRSGQTAEELLPQLLLTTQFDRECLSATLIDAVFAQQTQGIVQKLMMANWSPLPEIYPPEFLVERGYTNERLDARGMQMLRDKFQAS